MADRDIPEEMVEAALLGAMGFDSVQDDDCPQGDAYFIAQMRAALSAALAGRTVVQLPEPELVLNERPGMRAHAVFDVDSFIVTALAMEQGPRVNLRGGPMLWADEAERRGAALIAAAREARRLAADLGVGDQT